MDTLIKIESALKIAHLFSLLHDGLLNYRSSEGNSLVCDVELHYLAEQIQPDFERFQIILYGLEQIHFITWPNDLEQAPVVLYDLSEIFALELEILRGSVYSEGVEIICAVDATRFSYAGGQLRFKASGLSIFDQAGKSYSLEELSALAILGST